MNKRDIKKAAKRLAATTFADCNFDDKIRSMREDTQLTKEQAIEAIDCFIIEFAKYAKAEVEIQFEEEL